MKKLLILSGKGGTGKTTTAAAFIKFLECKAFADCDVDAPNLHLVTNLTKEPVRSDYYGSQKSFIDFSKCIGCGKCFENCRFNAIKQYEGKYKIDEFACEGCAVCHLVCPVDAITMKDDIAGDLMLYSQNGIFSTAKLKMGRGTSGKLVVEVKRQLPNDASEQVAIIDGSPGIGCPVIASISGVDLVLIVAEPSLSGISDMERIIKTANIFETKTVVCINKYNTCLENAKKIEDYCKEHGIDFVGNIPYDKNVSKAINQGKTVADIDCEATKALFEVFEKTMNLMSAK
ncbi:MAG: 4Fe-4S dicluster domain-containing protein [Clostridia bacterium]|nr:4Fe-4S dicluster domain-containing protein [Clostridia bacterium]